MAFYLTHVCKIQSLSFPEYATASSRIPFYSYSFDFATPCIFGLRVFCGRAEGFSPYNYQYMKKAIVKTIINGMLTTALLKYNN